MARKSIALFGSAAPRSGDPQYSLAYDIGFALAVAGYDLVNGGHEGTMEAASHGAHNGGARVVGVTCAPLREARNARINDHLDEVIDSASLLERIDRMIRLAAGFVILEGGTGTLAELGVVWDHVSKGLAVRSPIVLVGDFWSPTIRAITGVQPEAARHLLTADSASSVVDRLRQAEERGSRSSLDPPGRQS